MPSLVAASASGSGSCIQKPRAEPKARTAVTMPDARTACSPSSETMPGALDVVDP